MRRTLTALMAGILVLLVSQSAFADVPVVIPVQGILNDAGGDAINGSQAVTFTFYDDGGANVWSETFALDIENGFFGVGLGAGATPIDLAIFRDSPTMELGITVGTDAEMSPRMPVGSVPYAALAQWSETSLDAMALEGRTLADLDARFVTSGETDSVNGTMIADGTLTSADVQNPLALYRVTNLFCEQEINTLMTSGTCKARQTGVENCSNTCPIGQSRVKNCAGDCSCAGLRLCIVGVPCDPRGSYPNCTNQPLAGYALPAP